MFQCQYPEWETNPCPCSYYGNQVGVVVIDYRYSLLITQIIVLHLPNHTIWRNVTFSDFSRRGFYWLLVVLLPLAISRISSPKPSASASSDGVSRLGTPAELSILSIRSTNKRAFAADSAKSVWVTCHLALDRLVSHIKLLTFVSHGWNKVQKAWYNFLERHSRT